MSGKAWHTVDTTRTERMVMEIKFDVPDGLDPEDVLAKIEIDELTNGEAGWELDEVNFGEWIVNGQGTATVAFIR